MNMSMFWQNFIYKIKGWIWPADHDLPTSAVNYNDEQHKDIEGYVCKRFESNLLFTAISWSDISGSAPGVIVPPQGYLATSRDIFVDHSSGVAMYLVYTGHG